MKTSRTATAAVTALVALAAGGLLVASAATASAQDRNSGPVPDLARMHQQMSDQNNGMVRMHELHRQGNPGMARMHALMMDGPR